MDFLDCKICQVKYDEDEHRPRHAPCGHELCSACIRALIKNEIFECPNCRQKNKVVTPEDFPVSFGLIDVIRAFNSKKISFSREVNPNIGGATSEEMCKVHRKGIRDRCLSCKAWLCAECIDSHSPLIGCSIISSIDAMTNMKVEYAEKVKKQLATFDKSTNHVSDVIQKHADSKKELMEKVKKHDLEMKKLQELQEQGKLQKEKLIVSTNQLNASDSPYSVSDSVEVLTQRMQSLHIWSMKNLDANNFMWPKNWTELLKMLHEAKKVFVEMNYNNVKSQSKLSKHEEHIRFPSLETQVVPRDSFCLSFEDFQKMIPAEPTLVYVELSMRAVVKGLLLIRLKHDLPNISKYMRTLMTDQQNICLRGIKVNSKSAYRIATPDLPISKNCTAATLVTNASSNAKRGDVVGYFQNGKLIRLFFHVDDYDWSTAYRVLGSIENGMDLTQECYDNHNPGMVITDCGLIY